MCAQGKEALDRVKMHLQILVGQKEQLTAMSSMPINEVN